jgi:RNA polymerase sigma-70 factor (ECF subfamily)
MSPEVDMSGRPAAIIGQQDDDIDLIRRAQAYEEDALSAVFNIYYPKVYNYGLVQLHDVQSAEDLASDVMLRVLESLPRYQRRGVPLSAWVFRIARNRVVDIRRRSHRRREVGLVESLVTLTGGSPHSTVERALDFGEVCCALGQLTEAQEQVIVLRFLKDLDVATVARILGRSESAVKSIQFRALTALRRIMQGETELARSYDRISAPVIAESAAITTSA